MKGEEQLQGELEFLEAMQAYRRARDAGDADATKKAEDAWRELLRRELQEQ